MKKIHITAIALVAVFAFSAVAAVSASAEVALWLVDGAEPAAGTTTASEGLIEVEDLGAPGSPAIDCEVTLDGTIGPNGVDSITEVLVGGVKVELVLCKGAKACEAAMLVDVLPLKLPWTTQLELMANGEILDIVTGAAYEIMEPAGTEGCLILGIGASDKCEGPTSFKVENMTSELDVLDIASEAVGTESFSCSLGGAGNGMVRGEALVVLTGANAGLELSIVDP